MSFMTGLVGRPHAQNNLRFGLQQPEVQTKMWKNQFDQEMPVNFQINSPIGLTPENVTGALEQAPKTTLFHTGADSVLLIRDRDKNNVEAYVTHNNKLTQVYREPNRTDVGEKGALSHLFKMIRCDVTV